MGLPAPDLLCVVFFGLSSLIVIKIEEVYRHQSYTVPPTGTRDGMEDERQDVVADLSGENVLWGEGPKALKRKVGRTAGR